MGALTFRTNQRIGTLTIDLPDRPVNVLGTAVMEELEAMLATLEAADLDLLLLRSGKTANFIAGADIDEIESITREEDAIAKSSAGQQLLNRWEALPYPTVAVIHGACLGGGFEWALACDYRIATDHPKTLIGLPEVSLGIVPGWGGTYRLPRLIGPIPALKQITRAKPIDAKRALRLGLVDRVVPAGYVDMVLADLVDASALRSGKPRSRPGSVSVRTPILGSILKATFIRGVRRVSKGFYPAPLAAVDLVFATFGRARSKALAAERAALGKLAVGPVAKNLLRIYRNSEAAKKSRRGNVAAPIRRTGVVGAGVMGGRIAWVFSKAGLPVHLADISSEALAGGLDSAAEVYRTLVRKRRMSPREADLGMERISPGTDLGGARHADLVVEAVVEKLDIKRKVIADLESVLAPDAVIGTNTSSLSVGDLAQGMSHPDRLVGIHFFNPPNRMPLVEVVPHAGTAPAVVDRVVALLQGAKKIPIRVKDSPGFLVNRILFPYLAEAMIMSSEGYDIERTDRALEDFGMPVGPFRLLDQVGLDVVKKVGDVMEGSLFPELPAMPVLETLIEKGAMGVKSGEGFYRYTNGEPKGANPLVASAAAARRRSPRDAELVDRLMLPMVNEAYACLHEGIVEDAEKLDLALVYGIGFPPFRGGVVRYSQSRGLAEIVKVLRRLQADLGARFTPSAGLLEAVS